METEIIGIKQLYTRLKEVADAALAGKSFTVIKNSKPVFRIEPLTKSKDYKYTLKDLASLRFKSGDKKLSEKIDKLVYQL